MKSKRSITGLFLALVMVFTLVPFSGIAAFAEETGQSAVSSEVSGPEDPSSASSEEAPSSEASSEQAESSGVGSSSETPPEKPASPEVSSEASSETASQEEPQDGEPSEQESEAEAASDPETDESSSEEPSEDETNRNTVKNAPRKSPADNVKGNIGETGWQWSLEEIPEGEENAGYRMVFTYTGENDPAPKLEIPKDFVKNISGTLGDLQDSVTELEVPKGAAKIGENAFLGLTGLKKASIAETVQTIGARAFGSEDSSAAVCESLETVTIRTDPETGASALTSLGASAFAGCKNLTGIDLSATKLDTIQTNTFNGCESMEEVALPDTLRTVKEKAFYNAGLTNIDLPDQLNSVENSAFQKCGALQSASLPAFSYMSGTVGTSVFAGCASLEELEFRKVENRSSYNSSRKTLPANTLQNDTALKKLDLSGWEDYTYYSYEGLLLDNQFINNNLENLEQVVLPKFSNKSANRYVSIGNNAFPNKVGLTGLDVFENPEQIGYVNGSAFAGSGLVTADMSGWSNRNFTAVNSETFANCRDLETVVLPKNITTIGSRAFSNDQQLKEFTVRSENLASVAKDTFDGSGMEKAVIGKEVNSLTGQFFQALPSSADVYFEGESNLSIKKASGNGGTSPLKDLNGNYYADAQGVLYQLDDDGTASLAYVPPGIETLNVPETITDTKGKTYTVDRVNSNAVHQAKDLKALTFQKPEQMTLAPSAFSGWTTSDDSFGKTINGQTEIDPEEWGNASKICSFPIEDGNGTRLVTAIEHIIKNSDGKEILKTTIAVNNKAVSDDKTYDYKTGEKATYTIAIGNSDNITMNKVVRVYFAYDGTGYNMGSFPTGDYTLLNTSGSKYPLKVVETDTPGIYYYELTGIQPGETLAFQNDVFYPSPNTAGGGLQVWCHVISKEEAEQQAGKVLNPKDYIQMDWETTPVVYDLKKSNATVYNERQNTNQTPVLKANAEGEIGVNNLAFQLAEKNRGSSALTEGLDYIRWVWYEDVLDLPEGIEWRDGVMEAIQKGDWQVENLAVNVDRSMSSGKITTRALTVTVNGKKYELAYLYSPTRSYSALYDFRPTIITEDGVQKLKLTWYVNNSTLSGGSATAEYQTHQFYIRYGDDVLLADLEKVNELLKETDENGNPKRLVVGNRAEETRHYSYSPVQKSSSQVTRPVDAHAGINIEKNWNTNTTNYSYIYGGRHDYNTISITNTGIITIDQWGSRVPETGEDGKPLKDEKGNTVYKKDDNGKDLLNGNIITDNMQNYFYITEEDIEKMFAATAKAGAGANQQIVPIGDWMTLAIKKATLCTPDKYQPSWGVDEDAQKNNASQPNKYTVSDSSNISSGNDESARVKEAATITMKKNDAGQIEMTLAGDSIQENNRTYVIGEGGEFSTVKEAFRAIGFEVTANTTYNLLYHTDQFVLKAGQQLNVPILSTYKTTPMMLTRDNRQSNPNYYIQNTYNSATIGAHVGDSYVNKTVRERNGSSDVNHAWQKELWFYKYGYVEGSNTQLSGSQIEVNDGTTLDCYLAAQNYSNSAYDEMAMTDYMEGSQVLLAPVAQNPDLKAPDGSALEQYTSRGVTYWLLNKVGTYENVVIGSTGRNGTQTYVTDKIVVSERRSGSRRTSLNTLVKWKPLENWGATTSYTYLYYKVLVSGKESGLAGTEGADSSGSYSINNKAWLGDHQGHRLYDYLIGSYQVYGIKKNIVTPQGKKDGTDTKDNGGLAQYSRVRQKNTVTYQMEIDNLTSVATVLSGSRIRDRLPLTYDKFAWTRGDGETAANVTNLRYFGSDGVEITVGSGNNAVKLDTAGGSNEGHDDYWTVQKSADANGSYDIKWDKDFNIHFPGHSSVKILIDVTFPDRPESGASVWDQYVAAVKGGMLHNTFYLDSLWDRVDHSLEAEGKAVLYKGVYDTGITSHTSSGNTYISYSSNRSRWMYANGQSNPKADQSDLKASTVTYYTVLYNGSYDRLYLSDLQDQLPKGFTFNSMCNSVNIGSRTNGTYSGSNYTYKNSSSSRQNFLGYTGNDKYFGMNNGSYTVYETNTENYSSSQLVTMDNSKDELDSNTVKYVNARVKAVPTTGADGKQHIKFSIVAVPGTSSDYTVGYDSSVGKYYLNPGQAVRFGYNCVVGDYAQTEEMATNTVTMPYYDYYGVGFTLDVPDKDGKGGAVQKVRAHSINGVTDNDGICEQMTADDVANKFGADTSAYQDDAYKSAPEGNWMVSSVTVQRADFVPGVQKTVGGLTGRIMNPSATSIEGSPYSGGNLYGTAYTGGAKTSDVVNWRIRVFDEAGTNNKDVHRSMTDYTVEDTMVTPFAFTGQVFYNMYRNTGASGSRRTDTSVCLFTLGSRKENDTTVRIASGSSLSNTGWKMLKIGSAEDDSDDDWFRFGTGDKEGRVKVERDAEGQEKLTIQMKGSDYAIPPGYWMDLCLHTMYVADQVVISEGKYNDVILRCEQDYDAAKVAQGRAKTKQERDPETGKTTVVNDGVQSGASIMLTQGYTTNSWKKITETGDKDKTARSDESTNYINLSEKCKTFKYDLYMIGPQAVMSKIVLIDDLPQEGDHSAFVEADKRNSEFKVSFLSENPELKVTLAKAQGGTERELKPEEYHLYLSEKTEFEKEDWEGQGDGWTELSKLSEEEQKALLEKARSVRVVIEDPNAWQTADQSKYLMAAACQLHISFNAKIDDDTAMPGERAWNSFGYRYVVPLTFNGSAENSTAIGLDAQPLNVGVRFPASPEVVKSLTEEVEKEVEVDKIDPETGEVVTDPETGEPVKETVTKTETVEHKAAQDMRFGFLLYEGEKLEALNDALNMKHSEIDSVLKEAERKYIYVPVTVKAGESSASVGTWRYDNAYRYDSETGSFVPDEEAPWHWSDGDTYSVIELPLGDYNYEMTSLQVDNLEKTGNNAEFVNSNSSIVKLNAANQYVPVYRNLTGQKVWDDGDNQDGKRPESIHVRLLQDGEEIADETVTGDDWKWTFQHLLTEKETGEIIQYTVIEDPIEEYSTETEREKDPKTEKEDMYQVRVTNTHTPGKTSAVAYKTWDDADDQDGERPDSITVYLYADGEKIQEKTVTAEDDWVARFNDLPEHKDGKKIVYTVGEEEVPSYETAVQADDEAENLFQITNTHTPGRMEVTVTKKWDDADNQDGKRPESITYRLYADGKEIESRTVTKNENWNAVFSDLPSHKDGKEILYTVTEDAVEHYSTSIEQTAKPEREESGQAEPEAGSVQTAAADDPTESPEPEGSSEPGESSEPSETSEPEEEEPKKPEPKRGEIGFTVTNSYTPEQTSLSVVKTWDDFDDYLGLRPLAIDVHLYADGKEVEVRQISVSDRWAAQFRGLPMYENGKKITYTVSETVPAFYKAPIIEGDMEKGFTIKNPIRDLPKRDTSGSSEESSSSEDSSEYTEEEDDSSLPPASSQPDEPNSDMPTGESGSVVWYVISGAAAMAAVFGTVLILRRRQRDR